MTLTDDEIDALAEDLAERVEHWDPEVTIWNTNPDVVRLATQAREANALRAEVTMMKMAFEEIKRHNADQLASAQQQIAAMDIVVRTATRVTDNWKACDHRVAPQLEEAVSDYRKYLASQRPSVASQILGMGVARFEGETREVASVGGEEKK